MTVLETQLYHEKQHLLTKSVFNHILAPSFLKLLLFISASKCESIQ